MHLTRHDISRLDPTCPGRILNPGDRIGDAGAAAYQAAAELMQANNGSSRSLDETQKRYLRPYFGDLVDRVVVVYNANLMDEWSALGYRIDLPNESAAQTYCNRIYVDEPYQQGNLDQLILLAHELVHSRQCENYGGAGGFGWHYFKEFYEGGSSYENNRLEREAFDFEARFASEITNRLYVRYFNGQVFGEVLTSQAVSGADLFRDWSWDGSTASYVAFENGQSILIVRPFDGQTFGSVTSRQVVSSSDSFRGWSWDGSIASYVAIDGAGRSTLIVRPFNGQTFGSVTSSQAVSDRDIYRGWSWDGSTASYVAIDGAGRSILYVRPFDGRTFGSVTSSQAVSDRDIYRGWSWYGGVASYVTK